MTSVIVGATKMAQLQDNIAAVDLELSSEEMERLDGLSALSPEYPAWTPTVPRGVNPFAALGQL